MDANMQDLDHDGPERASQHRLPSGAVAATLHNRVAAVVHALESGRAGGNDPHSAARTRILEIYAGPLEDAMLALGEALAEFLYVGDGRADLETLRAAYLEPILSRSRSLAVYSRAEEWSRNKEKPGELDPHILDGRPVGFDVETLLLDNFYKNTLLARALRARVSAMLRLVVEEARSRSKLDPRGQRALVLGANSILQIHPPFAVATRMEPRSIFIADGDTQALRFARQRFVETFGVQPELLRAKPESLAKSRHRIRRPFDVIYSLMQYDMHSPQSALEFTRGLSEMLMPGGALITGCFLPSIPQSYRALALAFTDLEWQYWDEGMWREMLAQLPFDLSASRFETVEPATLAVFARRS